MRSVCPTDTLVRGDRQNVLTSSGEQRRRTDDRMRGGVCPGAPRAWEPLSRVAVRTCCLDGEPSREIPARGRRRRQQRGRGGDPWARSGRIDLAGRTGEDAPLPPPFAQQVVAPP